MHTWCEKWIGRPIKSVVVSVTQKNEQYIFDYMIRGDTGRDDERVEFSMRRII